MAQAIELLIGPAGAGKTCRLLRLYAQALQTARQRQEPGTTLWLAPSQRARQDVEHRLLELCPGVLFRPNVLTFDQFARRLLGLAAPRAAAISRVGQRVVLRGVIERLIADGAIVQFAGMAQTSGFIDLLLALIAELKRCDAWPEHFLQACQRRRQRDRELYLIYDAYQQVLVRNRLYDAEGLFWSAREAARAGTWGNFGRLELVVADGFADFTTPQYEILGRLAGHAGRVVVSLPGEAGGHRPELFAVGRRAAHALARHAAVVHELVDAAPGNHEPKALARIRQHLFSDPRQQQPSAETEGLSLAAVAGPAGEARFLAARVKELLLGGTSADDIVVAVRQLADYADLLGEAFRAAGIPHAIESGLTLARQGVVRALAEVARLELDDWPFERLMTLLENCFFRPAWVEWRGGAAARDVAASLRTLWLSSGREAMLQGLASAGAHDPAAARAAAVLSKLSGVLAPMRGEHHLGDWGEILRAIVADLGFLADEDSGEDRTALQELWNSLDEADRAQRLVAGQPPCLSLRALAALCDDLTRSVELPVKQPVVGHVRILTAASARHLDAPYLFVGGLTEESFPARRRDDCLLHEADRRALDELGVAVQHAGRQTEEEMLFFYRLLTRARRRLVLCWPAVNAKGEPESASSYVADVRALFSAESLRVELEEQLDPIPGADRLICPADLRVRAMHEALAGRPELLARALAEPATGRALEGALAAARMNQSRFHEPGFGPYEGWLRAELHKDWLAARFAPDQVSSVSQLEDYAGCPFRFFVLRVLAVPERATFEVATDWAARGVLVHSVLADLFREQIGRGGPALDRAALEARFLELARQHLAARNRPGVWPGLLRVEERALGELAAEFARQHEYYAAAVAEVFRGRPAPVLIEAEFGGESGDDSGRGEGAGPRLIIGAGAAAVALRGRVDRVDIVNRPGGPIFLLIDYKTGLPPRFTIEAVQSGRALQLVLYAVAVERQGLAGKQAPPGQLGFWHVMGQGFVSGLKNRRRGAVWLMEPQLWDVLRSAALGVVPNLVLGIRQGHFPVYNVDQECVGRCPLRTACRVGQIRALPDRLDKHWSPGARLQREASPAAAGRGGGA